MSTLVTWPTQLVNILLLNLINLHFHSIWSYSLKFLDKQFKKFVISGWIQHRDLANFSKQGVQMGLVYEVGCPSPTASGGRAVRRRRTAIAAGGLGAA